MPKCRDRSLNASSAALLTQQKTAMRELARAVTIAGSSNTTAGVAPTRSWPFVTVDLWESRASAAQTVGLDATLWTPLVELQQQDAWVQYTQQQTNDWLSESRNIYAATHGLAVAPLIKNAVGFIYDLDQDSNGSNPVPAAGDGPWAPIWQLSLPPDEAKFVNHNLLGQHFVLDAYLAVSVMRGESINSKRVISFCVRVCQVSWLTQVVVVRLSPLQTRCLPAPSRMNFCNRPF